MIRRFLRSRNAVLGSPRHIQLSKKNLGSERVAFLASYGSPTQCSRSVIELTRELSRLGYRVILVRATSHDGPFQWPDQESEIRPTIISRPNLGYDFGSWAVGLDSFPELASQRFVLMMNDSLVGPFAPLDEIIESFERSSADVWGATSTLQFTPHLQSFMVGFKGGILSKYPFRRFWRSIREMENKDQVILHYEIGLTQLVTREMFTSDVFIPAESVIQGDRNPAIEAWDRLLDSGFPFLKRELLQNERFALRRDKILQEIRRRYEVDPLEWFERV